MVVEGPSLMHMRAKGAGGRSPGVTAVVEQLERILANGDFDASPRSRAFLRFIVTETLAGRPAGLTQAAIAIRVFGRREDFDPTVDPIVRIQAGRLRRSLERYYLLSGAGDAVRIELPRGTYAPVATFATPRERVAGATDARHTPALVGWPTVLVSVSGRAGSDQDLEDAAAEFLDHLTLELGRYRDVRVVSRHEHAPAPASAPGGAMFALSARLAPDEGGLRLVARLEDRRTGSQVWAEEYRGGPTGGFIQETARVIAARVASEQGLVARQLWVERRARPQAEITPYGGILASYQFFFNRDPEDLAPAIEALQRVVAVEPECGLAWVQLSRLFTANHVFEVAPVDTPIEDAVAYAQNGVRLEPGSQRAQCALAGARLVKGELAAARDEAQSALDLNPDSLVYLEWIGWLMTMLGEWDRGPELVRRALARNPHVIPVAHHALWLAHLRRGDLEEAYQAALQYHDPTFFQRALMRACCLGHLGKPAEAKVEVGELLRAKPDFARRGRTLIGRLIKFPDLLELVVDGLGKAGLALD